MNQYGRYKYMWSFELNVESSDRKRSEKRSMYAINDRIVIGVRVIDLGMKKFF